MRKIGDLLKELGFNANAPISTQKAFLNHLTRVAEQSRHQFGSTEGGGISPASAAGPATLGASELVTGSVTENPTQLAFDPVILGIVGK